MTLPPIELLEYVVFSDPSSFFEPLTVTAPGTGVHVPQSLIETHKDEYWYINIAQDEAFEYRSVEVPFAVACLCPNRNLTEPECRSIGITQSKGWVNFFRDSGERNVFMFRRPLPNVYVDNRLKDEICTGLKWASAADPNTTQRSFIIFPASLLKNPASVFGERTEVTFTSRQQFVEFQTRVWVEALSLFSISNSINPYSRISRYPRSHFLRMPERRVPSNPRSPLLASLSANRRPSQFLDVTPVNEIDIHDILHCGLSGDGSVADVSDVKQFLIDCGFSPDATDSRLAPVFAELDSCHAGYVGCPELTDLKRNHLLVQKALSGDLAIPNFKQFSEMVTHIYHECKSNNNGSLASYIPQLAEVDPNLFGVSICTVDGQRFSIGDAQTSFSVQSVSKIVSYAIALEARGQDAIHAHVGMEPSGRNFNERVLLASGIPHNPLINTGAIMIASLLYPDAPKWKRYEQVSAYWERLTCAKAHVLQSTFLAERETANRNFCLAHMMAENDGFPHDLGSIQTVLDEYFGYCSLSVTADAMAVAAATFATGGLNPITDEKVFSPDTVTAVLSSMMTCGMYDASGEFSATTGFPAKSGVSGIILAVIPGVCGIATFSPLIDSLGNSVRGLDFFARLAAVATGIVPLHHSMSRPSMTAAMRQISTSFGNQFAWKTSGAETVVTKFGIREFSSLWWAAFLGDDQRIRQLAARGINVNEANYSNRTAMNFAIQSTANLSTVELLISLGADLSDDFFFSYVADADRVDRNDIVLALTAARDRPLVSPKVIAGGRIPVHRYFADSSVAVSEAMNAYGVEYIEGSEFANVHIRALCGKLIIPNWSEFASHVRSSANGAGVNVALATVDNQRLLVGSNPPLVPIDGIVRVVLYEIALDELGSDLVHSFVGREPSGQSESALRLNSESLPFNALTMAGCLAVCQLLAREFSVDDILDKVRSRVACSAAAVESITSSRKYMDTVQCAWYLLSARVDEDSFRESAGSAVEIFERSHALAVSLPALAEYGKTLALSFSPILSLLYSCGLDETSGEFSFRFGVPGRTSLSGVVLVVVPGVLGYAVQAPLATVRNQVLPSAVFVFQQSFAANVNFHLFRRHFASDTDPTLYFGSNAKLQITKFLTAAFNGDLSSMKHLVAEGVSVDAVDMDGRSALHIANGVGNWWISEWLRSVGANTSLRDVWRMTPDFASVTNSIDGIL